MTFNRSLISPVLQKDPRRNDDIVLEGWNESIYLFTVLSFFPIAVLHWFHKEWYSHFLFRMIYWLFWLSPIAGRTYAVAGCLLIVSTGGIVTNERSPLSKASSIERHTPTQTHQVQIYKRIIKLEWFAIGHVVGLVQVERLCRVLPRYDVGRLFLSILYRHLGCKGVIRRHENGFSWKEFRCTVYGIGRQSPYLLCRPARDTAVPRFCME
jgi:hypothetical protein